ncbi:TonB-dependent receptor [Methylobacterium sp. JK268]
MRSDAHRLAVTSLTLPLWLAVPAAHAQGDGTIALDQIDVAAPTPSPDGAAPPSATSSDTPAAAVEQRFEAARARILAPIGANVSSIGRTQIDSLPQGDNQPFNQVLLQLPGVTQDSASAGSFHIRNEHANAQYRINGVLLPEGLSGFGQFIETSFVGQVNLLTGALPAQFGLRTAGIIDIHTRTGAFENGGSIGLYGGVRGTITPSFTYGGHEGTTDWFVAGRDFRSNLGIENPTPSYNPIHDHTQQGKFFGYVSTLLDPDTRLTYVTGTSVDRYQIPNRPGLVPSFTAFGQGDFDSRRLNERQREFTNFNVIAVQRSVDDIDIQFSYFNRNTTLHFKPDILGDLLFNGVASDVYRNSFVNGIATDAAYRISPNNTLRFGFTASAEQTRNVNSDVLLPVDDAGNPLDAPFGVKDRVSKTGYLVGVYVQDEWKLTDRLTLNAGLRFDQQFQYVDANQLSPRVSLTYEPWDGTHVHAGYARNFTPPEQALSAPVKLPLFLNTTQQPGVLLDSPVKPERSHVFDVGIDQKITPELELGVDAYYKIARDLLDDGQFGQAYVLTAFNYARAHNEGVEIKARYVNGNFTAYGNLAIGQQRGTQIVSNQFLFDPDKLAYIATHSIYTDHAQLITASAGASYLYEGTRLSADMIYGSGLRSGFANTSHLPGYFQVNLGLARDVQLAPSLKPTTFRIDVVNLFDRIYQLRDGTGIGVFAPQYGPRRGVFAGISQRF